MPIKKWCNANRNPVMKLIRDPILVHLEILITTVVQDRKYRGQAGRESEKRFHGKSAI